MSDKKESSESLLIYFGLALLAIITLMVFVLIATVKIIVLLLMIFIINLIFRDSENTIKALLEDNQKVITFFKVKSFLKFLLAWSIYFYLLKMVFKGLPSNIFFESITCYIQIYASLVYTKNGYYRLVENYFSGKISMIFGEGLYFYPGIWFFYKISKEVKISEGKDGGIKFHDNESNEIKDNFGGTEIKVSLDTKDVLRSRKITALEDLIYTVFINNPKFRESLLNFDFRRFIISIFLTSIILMISYKLIELIN